MNMQRVQGPGTPVVGTTPPAKTNQTPATTPPVPSSDPTPAAAGVQTVAPAENQTQAYQMGPPPANDVNFPDPSGLGLPEEAQLRNVQTLFSDSSSVPTALREKQDQLAQSLGFRNRDALSHHLRRFDQTEIQLPSGERQNLRERLLSLVEQGLQAGDSDSVKNAFNQTFREAISSVFQRSPLQESGIPEPQFRSQARDRNGAWRASNAESKWDAASLASVYNGLETIYEQSPQRLLSVAQGAGVCENGAKKPLEFIRRDQPPIGNRDDYLNVLSEATRIAHAEVGGGQVFIYDTAVVGDQSMITDLVVDKLDLISRFQEGQLTPIYTSGEMADRGLNQANGERQTDYRARLREKVSTEYVARFGGMENLQKAMNFVTRYRNLPVPPVPENGQANDPQTLAVLQQFGTKLPEVMARMEQIDAVTKMQQFLKDNAPPGSPMGNLAVDGYIGNNTETMTRGFQAGLALNTFKERIEDDPQLGENRKRELVSFINQRFEALATHPEQAQQLLGQVQQRMNNLIAEQPPQISVATRNGLQQDVRATTRLVQGGHFNRETAEYLVNGWLNVMDSGEGEDLAEQLVVHELGHIWERDLERQGLEVTKNWSRLFDDSLQSSGYSTGQMNQADFHERLHDDLSASSDYGSASSEEDFAEAVRVFTYDPPRLMRRSLMKFLVVNALLPPQDRKSNQQIREMAAASGYTPQDLQRRLDAVLGFGESPIRFTTPMASRLAHAYSGLRSDSATGSAGPLLRSESVNPFTGGSSVVFPGAAGPGGAVGSVVQPLAFSDSPDSPGFPGFPMLELPESTEKQAQQPGLQESGWFFNALSERIAEIDTRLQDSGLTGIQRNEFYNQKQDLVNDFMTNGPGGISGLPVPETAVVASEQALLQNRSFGQGSTPQSGRAITAALAIYHATGRFEPGAYPQLSRHLPASFGLMLQNEGFQHTLNPGSPFSDTQMLESSLEFLKSISTRTDSANSSLGTVPVMVDDVNGKLRTLLSTLPNTSGLTYPEARARAQELMSDPAVMQAFASSADNLGAGLTLMNGALEGLQSIMNLPDFSISSDKFKHLLLTAALLNRTQGESFSSFATRYMQLENARGNS